MTYSLISPAVSTSKIGSGNWSWSSAETGPYNTGSVSGVSKCKSKGLSELFFRVKVIGNVSNGTMF